MMFSFKTILLCAAFLAAMLPGNLWAQTSDIPQSDQPNIPDLVAACRSEPTNTTRLACYDNIVDTLLDNTKKVYKSKKWQVTVETIRDKGINNVYAALPANEYIQTARNVYTRPVLNIRCFDGKLDGYSEWETVLGKESTVVTTRFGGEEPVNERGTLSSDKKGVFVKEIDSFIETLMVYKSLYIKISPEQGDPFSATFDLDGATSAMKAVISACMQ